MSGASRAGAEQRKKVISMSLNASLSHWMLMLLCRCCWWVNRGLERHLCARLSLQIISVCIFVVLSASKRSIPRNYFDAARDTQRFNPTLDVEHSNERFLGSLVLNLWDCGGQHVFYENYFTSKRDHIFSDVAVLIYVFDVMTEDLEVRHYSKGQL